MGLLPLAFALSLLAAPPPAGSADELCAPQWQLIHPQQCLALGPGAYAAQVSAARLPESIPDLPLAHLPRYERIVEHTYARVTTPDAPLFASPQEALAGAGGRSIGRGFIFVNLTAPFQEGDHVFYKIRTGEYIHAADVSVVQPSRFQGVGLNDNPPYPFGWIVASRGVPPSLLPGATPPRSRHPLPRRSLVQIFAVQRVGQWDWFMIGPNQWVEQRAIAKVDLNPPPEGVTDKWIQVNLYEQTLAAYEGGRMVYATLVSSGLDKWATEPGLFHIWARLKVDNMRGSYEPDGSDYYSLEAVPWVMYFDGQRALHGEYWHDRLGFKRSHGCVNLAPLDARWLFDWAEKGTPVWVYDPSGQTPVGVEGGSAP